MITTYEQRGEDCVFCWEVPKAYEEIIQRVSYALKFILHIIVFERCCEIYTDQF